MVLSIDDLADEDVTTIMRTARGFLADESVSLRSAGGVVGLLFLASSLRTRTGYAVAAARLGMTTVDVADTRRSPVMSAGESFADTLRTVSGMVDAVVVRVPFTLDAGVVASSARGPVLNAGDEGGEHPTQALIDLFAIEMLRGPVDTLRLAICGDLGSRTVRSLVKLLDRFPPRSLTLVGPPGRDDPRVKVGPELEARVERRPDLDVTHLDVLYLAGLPAGRGATRLSPSERARYAVDPARLDKLPGDAVVLSPMPVIDEISDDARGDRRVRIHAQSDMGVAVRMAVLASILSPAVPGTSAARGAQR